MKLKSYFSGSLLPIGKLMHIIKEKLLKRENFDFIFKSKFVIEKLGDFDFLTILIVVYIFKSLSMSDLRIIFHATNIK